MTKKRTRTAKRSSATVRENRTRKPERSATPARAPRLSKLSPQQRGAITRAANKAGKNPARVFAGLKAAETRAKNLRAAERDQRARARARAARKATRARPEPTTKPRARAKKTAKPKRKKRGGKSEYAVSADYSRTRHGKAVTIQIAAIGPHGATKQQAQDAVDFKINHGHSPHGWKIRIVDWRGHDYTGGPVENDNRRAEGWHTLSAPLALADIEIRAVGSDEA